MDFGSEQIERGWVIGVPGQATLMQVRRPRRAEPAMQRVIDVTIAALMLLFLSPLFFTVAAISILTSRGPVFFGHVRVGRDGRSFKCWKFRSMVVDAEARLQALLDSSPAARAEWASDHKLKVDPRITPFGAFLRKTSLDELPQFWNVIKGEMSLVGPRPIVRSEIPKYGRRYALYCSVKPGVTGLWQVSGRSDASYRKRVALDSLYARRKSVGLDLWILLATVPAVILAKGSY